MTISFVAAGTGVNGDNNLTPGLPAGVQQGDLLLIYCAQSDDSAGEIINTPSGYEQLAFIHDGANHGSVLFGKIAGASESGPTITTTNFSTGDEAVAQMAAFRGTLDNIESVVAHMNKGTFTDLEQLATEIKHVDLEVDTDNCCIIACASKRTDWASVAVLTTDALSWAEIGEYDTASSDDCALVWDYVVQTTAADISAGTFSVTTGQDDDSTSIMLAIKPSTVNTIKTDTFTVGSNTTLDSHTSDSGGGWQGNSDAAFTALATTDDVQCDAGIDTVIGDEANTETDYFVEIEGTLGGVASNDRIGVVARGQDGATHSAGLSFYYLFRIDGDSGWKVYRVEGAGGAQIDFNTGTVADGSFISNQGLDSDDPIRLKMTVTGVGATVTCKLEIDVDVDGTGFRGYEEVSTVTDTDSQRIVTAGAPGFYMRDGNARVTYFNSEDFTVAAGGGPILTRRSRIQRLDGGIH